MEDTLYVDVLFFVNFAMDFISLYITAKILHLRQTLPRFILSASIGGIYGVAAVLIPFGRTVSFFSGLILSFVMVLITSGLGAGFLKYVKYTAVLWGVGALLAGVVTFICSLGDNLTGKGVVFSKGQSSFFILSVASFAAVFIVKCFIGTPKAESCNVTVMMGSSKVAFTALVDSGNLVAEPVSGLPVIFVKKEVMSSFIGKNDCENLLGGKIQEISEECAVRVRAVAVNGVGGKTVLYGITVDGIDIEINKKHKKAAAVIVAEDKKGYGGREGLMPQRLIV